MTTQQISEFFNKVMQDPVLQQKLADIHTDALKSINKQIRALAKKEGSSYSNEEYTAWWVAQAQSVMLATKPGNPQYGFPNSFFPPIPPPMPTYLPPPPYIPPDGMNGSKSE
jgi:hypothetical protein